MQELSQNLNHNALLKERIVPLEERKSQKLGVWDFVKEHLPIFILGKLGALAGYFLGKAQETNAIRIAGLSSLNRGSGMAAGGIIGGVYGMFYHWKKTRGSQLGVENLHTDMKEAMSVDYLQKEVGKEQEIVDGISYLTDEKAKNMSYADYINSRRQAVSGVKEIN